MKKKIRILIVEDSEEDTLLEIHLVEMGGYDVYHERVETAEDMNSALNDKKWDVILSDFTMPHFSGLEALSLLKESGLDIPFIIISGTIGEEIAVKAMRAGAQDYIMKNELKRLVPAIERELHEAEGRAERMLLEQNKKLAEEALLDSEERFSAVFRYSPLAIAIFRAEDECITDANDVFINMSGCSREEIIGHTTDEIGICLDPSDRDTILQKLQERGMVDSFEFDLRNKAGEVRTVISAITFVDIKGVKHYFALILDITKRKKADQALKESENKYRTLFENANDGIFIMKGEVVVMCNNRVLEIFGVGVNEMTGKTLVDLSPEFQPDGMKSKDKAALFINKSLSDQPQYFEWLHKRFDGKLFYAEISLNRLVLNNVDFIQVIIRDISEKKQLERKIFQAIVKTEEKERERFAMELHDGLGPLFSTIKLYAESVQEENDPETRKSVLKIIQESVTEAISSLREISNNISPHILHNFGLISAVGSFVEKINLTKKVNVSYKSNTKERFQEIIEITIYRVLIELINNTLKHALAENIEIRIEQAGNILNILYSDDGKGIDLNTISDTKKGMGMFNIQNRIKSLNGQIRIDSKKDKGVKVNILINLNDKEL